MEEIRPKTAWLTVNRGCNLRCQWCYAQGTEYRNDQQMDLNLACQLLELIGNLGIQNFLLIGGEPTLWTPLLEFNRYCVSASIKQTLVTNTLRFGNDRFWDAYQDAPNTNLGISVKASNLGELKRVARSNQFAILAKGLVRAVSMFRCGVGVTYNTFYTDTLIDMAKFVMDCGASSLKLDFCSTSFVNGKPSDKFMVSPKEIVANILRDYQSLVEITEGRITFEMNMPLCLWPHEFIQELINCKRMISVCHVHKRRGVIFDTDGRLIMCNGLFDYPLGQFGTDFADAEGLIKYLNQPEVLEMYEHIGSYPSTECVSCPDYLICGGGCPLKWAVYRPEELIRPQTLTGVSSL